MFQDCTELRQVSLRDNCDILSLYRFLIIVIFIVVYDIVTFHTHLGSVNINTTNILKYLLNV